MFMTKMLKQNRRNVHCNACCCIKCHWSVKWYWLVVSSRTYTWPSSISRIQFMDIFGNMSSKRCSLCTSHSLTKSQCKVFPILMSIQTIEALTAAVGSGCTDFPFMIAIFNIWIFIAFFKDDTNELNLILRDERADMTLATTQLQNIFKSYNEIWAYYWI